MTKEQRKEIEERARQEYEFWSKFETMPTFQVRDGLLAYMVARFPNIKLITAYDETLRIVHKIEKERGIL